MSETDYNDDVINQLAAIREGGYCNMFDRRCVRDVARQIGFDELLDFIDNGSASDYMDHLEEMGRRQ